MSHDHRNDQVHASDQQNAAHQTPENHTTKGNMAQLVETLEVLEGFCKEQEEKEWARRIIVLCSVTKVMLRREERAAKLKQENQRLESSSQSLGLRSARSSTANSSAGMEKLSESSKRLNASELEALAIESAWYGDRSAFGERDERLDADTRHGTPLIATMMCDLRLQHEGDRQNTYRTQTKDWPEYACKLHTIAQTTELAESYHHHVGAQCIGFCSIWVLHACHVAAHELNSSLFTEHCALQAVETPSSKSTMPSDPIFDSGPQGREPGSGIV